MSKFTKGNTYGFQPGVSGNPRGRPPTSLLEPARELTALALDQLEELALHAEDEHVRLSAAVAILDRGWGKPAQTTAITADITTNVGGIDRPPPIINETDAEWLERRRRELAALTEDPDKRTIDMG